MDTAVTWYWFTGIFDGQCCTTLKAEMYFLGKVLLDNYFSCECFKKPVLVCDALIFVNGARLAQEVNHRE